MQLLATTTVEKAKSVEAGNDPLCLSCLSPCGCHPVSTLLLKPAAWGWHGAAPLLHCQKLHKKFAVKSIQSGFFGFVFYK